MINSVQKNHWSNKRIGITGAKGSLGRALTKRLRAEGAVIVGITHGGIPIHGPSDETPQEWVQWECGREDSLKEILAGLDILILNHGINHQGRQSYKDLSEALEVNALSTWRLMRLFQSIAEQECDSSIIREVWINTSEAEIQPALSPAYEISKRLIGQLVTINWSNLSYKQRKKYKIKKLILGPFRSSLNPYGLMSAKWVANQIIFQTKIGLSLIIITPNPITYFLMPIAEASRIFYSRLMQLNQGRKE